MQKLTNYEREKAIYRYVTALDNGDLDSVAEILELALYDPELARVIEEIDLAYQEEEGITSIATDASIVRDLIQQYLRSAFEPPNTDSEEILAESLVESIIKPLTVGDVAKRLQQSKSLRKTEHELLQSLINSSIPIPSSLSLKAIKQLFADNLQQNPSSRFLDNFRQVAIKLGMGRSYNNAQLAAARQHKKNYKSSHK